MRVTNWPYIFVDQDQFSDPDFISGTHQKENVQFADKLKKNTKLFPTREANPGIRGFFVAERTALEDGNIVI